MHEFEKCHALLLMVIDKHLAGIQDILAKEPQGKFSIPLVGLPYLVFAYSVVAGLYSPTLPYAVLYYLMQIRFLTLS